MCIHAAFIAAADVVSVACGVFQLSTNYWTCINSLTALTDGDQFQVSGSRVLIQDDKLWPMAKGAFK